MSDESRNEEPTLGQLRQVEAALLLLPKDVIDALLDPWLGDSLIFDYWLSTRHSTDSFIRLIISKYVRVKGIT